MKLDENKYLEELADSRCPSHSGILVNTCLGKKWVYIDEVPEFAVTYSYCVGGCGVFGKVSSSKAIKEFLNEVFEQLKNDDIYDFEFSCEKPELTQQILSLFPEKTIHSEKEYSYRFVSPCRLDETEQEKYDYEICPINQTLLEQLHLYENQEMVLERMENSWEEDVFLLQSVGYVAIKDHKIIGIIFGSGKFEQYVAIDIEVCKEYRRKRIAENLTKSFLTECQKRNLVAQWDCVESNVASKGVAQKVGFELFKKRPYYWFDI